MWIHHERAQSGGARADDVDARHVADVPRILRGDVHCLEREMENPRVGFHDADRAGVDDAVDFHTDARPDLQDLAFSEALSDQSIGVRNDPETHARRGQRAEAVA
jgi:hypothetical protein